MSARHARLFAGAAVAGLVVLAASFASEATARMRCSFSGAPQNLLTVTADRGALGEVTRSGERIVVREFLERPGPCEGGVPTVLNTDTITVLPRGESFVEVLLGGGPFAPGATPESEGASEIEIVFRARETLAEVRGTSRADEFHWGRGPANKAGLNLNPRDAGDQEVDVTIRGGLIASVGANGAGGNDTIIPAPGAPFSEDGVISRGGRGDDRLTAPRNGWGILDGGAGDDELTGGRQGDNLLGAAGNDRLRGAGGPDLIAAGRGRDLIFGGPGRDGINSGADVPWGPPRDSRRDSVRCGAGRDRVRADREDGLLGCEAIRHR